MGAVFLAMTSKGSASPPRSDLKSARQEEITYKHGRHHKRVTFSAPCPCQSTGETAGAAMGVMSAVSQATPHMPPQTFIPPIVPFQQKQSSNDEDGPERQFHNVEEFTPRELRRRGYFVCISSSDTFLGVWCPHNPRIGE